MVPRQRTGIFSSLTSSHRRLYINSSLHLSTQGVWTRPFLIKFICSKSFYMVASDLYAYISNLLLGLCMYYCTYYLIWMSNWKSVDFTDQMYVYCVIVRVSDRAQKPCFHFGPRHYAFHNQTEAVSMHSGYSTEKKNEFATLRKPNYYIFIYIWRICTNAYGMSSAHFSFLDFRICSPV